jgi:hypothetical protein
VRTSPGYRRLALLDDTGILLLSVHAFRKLSVE